MSKHLAVIILLAVIYCATAATAKACDVTLQVRNSSGFSILAIAYQKRISVLNDNAGAWFDINIFCPIGPSETTRAISLTDVDGDYDIKIKFTSQTDPIVIEAGSICSKSELVLTSSNVFVR
jgi:hypothetical protein